MKYLSYIIIVVVMGIIGWSTDNSLDSIFPERIPAETVQVEQLAKITEKETVASRLDSLLGQ